MPRLANPPSTTRRPVRSNARSDLPADEALLRDLRTHIASNLESDLTLAALAPSPTWPIAFALAAMQTGATAHDSVLAYGFSWAENQVQAALKSVPLGQSAGQRILTQLAQDLAPLARTSLTLRDDQRQAFAPLLAIRSSQHETQYSRLFRS